MKKILLLSVFIFVLNLMAFAQSDIRKVDFQNFTYEPYCAGEETEKITVKNGEFSREKEMDGYTDRFYLKAFQTVYGDLTGDGKEEAVILTVCNTGGTGNFTEGFIYGMKGGKATLLTRIEGGDRAYGGLREARIENGILIVESNDVGEAGGACCPEFVVTSFYKLSGSELKETKKSDRRELYPSQRVTFPKGSSGTTLTVNVPAQELKRLVVGARAGQTLSVSINAKNASLRILEDADVKDETTKLTAKLPKNGDYTIEVQNFEETEKEISVTIKIN
ncbi:MAG TPA: hypothetical protein PKY59_10390 [Pyrinomonadaceae bacterium]|nr:hypothetical protein [Pyrinomonadaceae bacterium]